MPITKAKRKAAHRAPGTTVALADPAPVGVAPRLRDPATIAADPARASLVMIVDADRVPVATVRATAVRTGAPVANLSATAHVTTHALLAKRRAPRRHS